jgi:MFS transporter, Spinster family, sphingosine-1-phosphate transporter
VSLLVWSGITWATGRAANAEQLIAARALMGVSEAFYLPAALALIAGHHGPGSRSLATGLHYTGIYAGVVLGGVGGGWLGATYGWRFPFAVLGIVGALYSMVLVALPNAPVQESRKEAGWFESIGPVLRTPGFGAIGLVFASYSVAGWLIYTWMPVYLFERFGMSLAEAGFNATFYIQLGSLAGVLLGGSLGDRWSRLGAQASALGVAAPFLFLAGFGWVPLFVLIGLAVYGIGRGAYDANNMPVVCQMIPVQARATAYGFLNMVGTLAGGLIALIAFAAGAMKEAVGISPMLQISAVLLLMSSLVLYRLRAVGNRRQSLQNSPHPE